MSARRLAKEFEDFQRMIAADGDGEHLFQHIVAIDKDDSFKSTTYFRARWLVTAKGGAYTPYTGTYRICFQMPVDYPFKPPLVKFLTKPLMCSVTLDTGRLSEEMLSVEWSPALTVVKITEMLMSKFVSTGGMSEDMNGVNREAVALYKKDFATFCYRAAEHDYSKCGGQEPLKDLPYLFPQMTPEQYVAITKLVNDHAVQLVDYCYKEMFGEDVLQAILSFFGSEYSWCAMHRITDVYAHARSLGSDDEDDDECASKKRVVKDERLIRVVIKTLAGKAITLNLAPSTSLMDLRKEIHKITGMPIVQMRLVSKAK